MTPAPEPAKCRTLANRREQVTQKVRIGGKRTLYVSVHDDPYPAELFLRIKGADCTSETIALYDILARLASLALQYGTPLEKLADMLAHTKFEPCGPVLDHSRIKFCTSIPDFIGRHLLVECCGRDDMAHVTEATG